jgi:hypothetical protein
MRYVARQMKCQCLYSRKKQRLEPGGLNVGAYRRDSGYVDRYSRSEL